jgi:hypothetical protein
MKLKQGTILPTTAIGVGYIFLLIYFLIIYQFGLLEVLKNPISYFLLLFFLLMQFSYKDFIVNENIISSFIVKYRLIYFIPIEKINYWSEYKYIVFKQINKSYRVSQGVAPGLSINQGINKEKYYALVACKNGQSEVFELCKGSIEELDTLIKKFILPSGVVVYKGARKKGYEYIPKNTVT